MPDWVTLKDHLLKEGKMYKSDLIQLILGVTEVMSNLYICNIGRKGIKYCSG